MPRIAPDHRSRDFELRPEIHRWLVDFHPEWVQREVDLAKAFAEILESKHYYDEACASLKQYARKIGYDAVRAMKLAKLGQAIALDPRLEKEFRSGKIPIESGPYLHDALRNEKIRNACDWIALARELSAPGLGAHVRHAVEAAAQGTKELRTLSFLVTDRDRDNFRRARFLLQAKLRRALTDGEAFSKIGSDWLEAHDPVFESRARNARRKARPETPKARTKRLDAEKRRHKKRSRHIPDPTVDCVVERADGRCEIPGCTNEGATELMHLVVPFDQGGDPVPHNVGLGCPTHHVMVDGVTLKCIGFSDDDRPIFEDKKGWVFYPEPRPPQLDST